MKCVTVEISPEFIGKFCKTTGDRCVFFNVDGIPPGSEFLGACFDDDRNLFIVKFCHKSFRDIPCGEILPVLEVRHTAYSGLPVLIDNLLTMAQPAVENGQANLCPRCKIVVKPNVCFRCGIALN